MRPGKNKMDSYRKEELLLTCFCFSTGVMMAMYILGGTLFAFGVANLHAWAKALKAMFFSQGKHLRRAMSNTETTMLTHLFAEVDLMAEMVKVSFWILSLAFSFSPNLCVSSVWTRLRANKADWSE